jgi:hypothetical protein
MPEMAICQNCGAECPSDANYCAHCGQKFKPSSDAFVDALYGTISRLTPIHLLILGFLLMTIVGSLSEYLFVSKLCFGFSVFLVVLVIGGGLAYLGWKFYSMSSIRKFLLRMLIVFASIGVSLFIIRIFDRVLLYVFTDGSEMVFYRMPGVYVASSVGTRRVTIENAPPYWLIVTAYGMALSVIGNLAQRLYIAISKIAY